MIVKIGDLFESHAQVLVNTVNCVGVMGKGIAKEFKKRFPYMFDEYKLLCEEKKIRPGVPYMYSNLAQQYILNFPTKDHWKSPSKLSYVIAGLDWFRAHYKEYNISSVAFPPLGCGNGGLSWSVVGPLMYSKLHDLPLDIEIYAPFGTPTEQLSEEYLKSHVSNNAVDILGEKSKKFNKYWYLLLYVVQQLNQDEYSLSVGRVIFQKVCYVLTRFGIPTGFVFRQGSYGPFSEDVKNVITVFSNANLLKERPTGSMIETVVNQNFVLNRNMFSDEELSRTEQALDLLSRIKDSHHAEMIATVLFSYDQLCLNNADSVSDEDILSYILNWKKRWRGMYENEVQDMIMSLSALGYIHPSFYNYSFSDDDLY